MLDIGFSWLQCSIAFEISLRLQTLLCLCARYLEGIANILLAFEKNKFRPLVREFYNTGLNIQQRIDKQSEESVLSERELTNFVFYEDLVKRRDALEVEWMKT